MSYAIRSQSACAFPTASFSAASLSTDLQPCLRSKNRPRGTRPTSLRDSIRIIGELRPGLGNRSIRTTRLSRGERYAALVHTKISRLSPQLGDELCSRMGAALKTNRSRDIGERFIRATDTAVRDLVHDGLISRCEGVALLREAHGSLRRKALPPREAPPIAGTTVASSPYLPPQSKGPATTVTAPTGFLWKPFSDSDGLLVILLPPDWTERAQEVEILSPDGTQILASGRPSGIGNGGRAHFRFPQPGSSFPEGAIVRIRFDDGSTQTITIQNPAIRGEGRS